MRKTEWTRESATRKQTEDNTMKKPKKQKPAESWRVIKVPIWSSDVLIYCGPWGSFLKRLKEAGVDDEGVADVRGDPPNSRIIARTYRLKDGGGSQAVYSPKDIQTVTLVHELYHVTYGILDAKGVLKDDEEAFAYTLEYLYKEATK